jgi:two-component system, chemotaxis family, protein-glutamate methylesterase/glutaminase
MVQQADNIIVIGGSAGGLEVLVEMVAHFPRTLPAAVFVVIHVAPLSDSQLPAILRRSGLMPVKHAKDGDPIHAGHIYVAPPDRHLIVESDRMRVTQGPRENHHRPAIDPLFRSAAKAFHDRVIGVLLSGALDDGVAGLLEIKRAGGIAVVQDPHSAIVPSMPRRALEVVPVDHVAAQGSLAPLLTRLVEGSMVELASQERKAVAAASSHFKQKERRRCAPIHAPSAAGCSSSPGRAIFPDTRATRGTPSRPIRSSRPNPTSSRGPCG